MSDEGLLAQLRVDLASLHVPADLDADQAVTYRANAVGRDHGIEEMQQLLRSDDTVATVADRLASMRRIGFDTCPSLFCSGYLPCLDCYVRAVLAAVAGRPERGPDE